MATFAEQMVAKLQATLLENPAADSVTVDGTTVSFADLVARLEHWESRVAREAGGRPSMMTIDLGGH
jgi:hypothetical protein